MTLVLNPNLRSDEMGFFRKQAHTFYTVRVRDSVVVMMIATKNFNILIVQFPNERHLSGKIFSVGDGVIGHGSWFIAVASFNMSFGPIAIVIRSYSVDRLSTHGGEYLSDKEKSLKGVFKARLFTFLFYLGPYLCDFVGNGFRIRMDESGRLFTVFVRIVPN